MTIGMYVKREQEHNSLGLTSPCVTVANCLTRSNLLSMAILQVSGSTAGRKGNASDSRRKDIAIIARESKQGAKHFVRLEVSRERTEQLVWLPEAKKLGVEVHELPVGFCSFLPHFGIESLVLVEFKSVS